MHPANKGMYRKFSKVETVSSCHLFR